MSDFDSLDLKEQKSSKLKEDGWQKIKPLLPPFRPEGCDITKLKTNEATLEEERLKHATRLMVGYFHEKGYTIHPNAILGNEDFFGLDFPFEAKRIVFPRHIMTASPDEDIAGKNLVLRRDVPILYILAGFAHEATHLDRYASDTIVVEVMDKMVEDKYLEPEKINIRINADGKITPEVIEEEAETDTQAFFLLRDLGVEVEAENYCTYVGRGECYERIVYDRIKKRLPGKQ